MELCLYFPPMSSYLAQGSHLSCKPNQISNGQNAASDREVPLFGVQEILANYS